MAIRLYKAYSPGIRFRSSLFFNDLRKIKPEKSLTFGKKRCSGRNHHGIITVRGRGGGHKRKYRTISFRRNKAIFPSKVISIEYDPNRNARIAKLSSINGQKDYILSPCALKINQTIHSGPFIPIRIGNSLPLSYIPVGSVIHNVELTLGKGGQIARAAGACAQLIAKEGDFVTLKLPSNEIRLVNNKCYATLGQVGNVDSVNVTLGKAGRKRWLGRRPKVRGVAQNPIDHPHGGGESKSPIGRPRPVTPWGKPALGFKTRNKTSLTNRFILRSRR